MVEAFWGAFCWSSDLCENPWLVGLYTVGDYNIRDIIGDLGIIMRDNDVGDIGIIGYINQPLL